MNLNFSQILRDLRQESDLTQAQLSEKLGYTQSNICEWEKGTVEPKANALIALAEFFSVSVDYLLGLDGELGAVQSSVHGGELSSEERELVNRYRALNASNKKYLNQTIEILSENVGRQKKID